MIEESIQRKQCKFSFAFKRATIGIWHPGQFTISEMADTAAIGDEKTIKITIQGSAVKFSLDVKATDTIFIVKEKVCGIVSDADPSRIKIIYSGRILKNEQTVGECGIGDGHCVHMVKSAPTASGLGGSASNTTGRQSDSNPARQPTFPLPTTQQQQQQPGNLDALSTLLAMPELQNLQGLGINQAGIPEGPEFNEAMARMFEACAENPALLQTLTSMMPPGQAPPPPMMSNPEELRALAQLSRAGFFRGRMDGSLSQFRDQFGVGDEQPLTSRQDQAPTDPPEIMYATQLEQLNEMGFWDKKSNIEALQICRGSVSQAIEYLISHPPN